MVMTTTTTSAPSLESSMTMATRKLILLLSITTSGSFTVSPQFVGRLKQATRLFSDWKPSGQNEFDSNTWSSANDPEYQEQDDWQGLLAKKEDGSFWSDFASSEEEGQANTTASFESITSEEQAAEAWLDTLASLGAEEVEFNLKEADRADKVRQMEEWGFDARTISNTLDVATTNELEQEDVEGMKAYREESYLDDDIDLRTVESHVRVEKDTETGKPIRTQMVYVDEHTCIGCTNCATTAQSTFFMHDEHGRARVFEQWGDDDETIQIAIETCPVDCIHYVPYEELVSLEKDRRNQNINFKARLVSQGEYGGLGLSQLVGSANGFTAPQQISGNMRSRCNNCPSRGCYDCPMYGVGKNPEFEKKEKLRKAKIERRRIEERREQENKSADL